MVNEAKLRALPDGPLGDKVHILVDEILHGRILPEPNPNGDGLIAFRCGGAS